MDTVNIKTRLDEVRMQKGLVEDLLHNVPGLVAGNNAEVHKVKLEMLKQEERQLIADLKSAT